MKLHEGRDMAVMLSPIHEKDLASGEVRPALIDYFEFARELKEARDGLVARLDRARLRDRAQEANVTDAPPTDREIIGNRVVAWERLQISAQARRSGS